ncbi:SOS response-associated protein [Rubrivivax sp. A210]|uniref:SOS response-associated peptidase n=1 Tax=Rubrivivax sp. A210 TaxID=2772301 RepID=UPI0019181AC7|nr:SOS response-associated peptidase family protein [Rubrivivax sp. A210]CAD5371431.1 SOS response-associated protein [Rubrivivax sp. A210]
MCTRYISPEDADIERHWHIGAGRPLGWARDVRPRSLAPFVRVRPGGPARELVVGSWSLLPAFERNRKPAYATCNARSEGLLEGRAFKQAWLQGQRCLIPALAFFEPCWETGRHVPWEFRRADGDLWALAGLWNSWQDRASGEIVETYTMLTINADGHALMGRMHKPDPARPPDRQDKRSVIPVERAGFDRWLGGSVDEARALLCLPPVELFEARGTGEPDPQAALF